MSQEQAKAFIEQATQSIQSGQFSQALELADQAIALTPDDSEAQILRGIALSQTQRPDEASEAFRRAITLSPYNAKAYFNLAVHLYGTGQKVEALEMAREAASIDVKHSGARELAARIESEMHDPSTEQSMAHSDPLPSESPGSPGPMPMRPTAYVRPDDSSGHCIALVEKMGKGWGAIAWILALVSGVGFVMVWARLLPQMQKMFANPQAAQSPEMQAEMRAALDSSPLLQVYMTVGMYGLALLAIVWMIMDILDKRGNWLWVIPIGLLTCVGMCLLSPAVPFLSLPLYLLLAKRNVD